MTIIFVARSGKCLFVNGVAQEIVNRREGLLISNSRLWANSSSERAKLHALIQGSCTNAFESYGGSIAILRNGKKPLCVTVQRLSSENVTQSNNAVAIVFISDPERAVKTTSTVMTSLFGFTRAECRLAELLLSGYSLKDAAEQRGVTYETVRSQVKSIFSKTGVQRQSELMGLLAAMPKIIDHA